MKADIFKTLRDYFSEKADIHTVLLYGSAADNTFAEESDIDLAVAGEGELTPDELVEIHQTLEKMLSRKVDLRDLSRLHGLILSQVLLYGTMIKKADPAYFEKRMSEMIEFRQDILPIQREGMICRLKEFVHGLHF